MFRLINFCSLLKNVRRFAEPNFTVTEKDAIHANGQKSKGIEQIELELDACHFQFINVEQPCERRKWIHCFECVTAVIFCASLSCYDEYLEDGQYKMKDTLLLFEELRNSVWFKSTPFIVFLNKTDVFREKFRVVPLTVCFPHFQGEFSFFIQKSVAN